MIGVVLCGGQSTRMGSDKGLLDLDDTTWTQAAINKLAAIKIPVCIVVNKLQYNKYATAFAGTTIITDSELLTIHGPLLGVLSAHLQYPMQNLFVLACDMPLMETSVLSGLYNQYLQINTYDAFVFTNQQAAEPLCSIYCAKGLATILAMYKSGALTRHSMKFMLEHLDVCYVSINEEQKKYFKNFNAPADINGA